MDTQNSTDTTTTTTVMTDRLAHGRRDWGRTLAMGMLVFGVALAATIAFTPDASAAPGLQTIDPSSWADSAITFLKKMWVFVIIAEVVAALTYAAAFFLQSWFPSFFQIFQGDWVKKAVIIGVAAHPVMAALFAAAEGAKGGFQ